MKLAVDCGNGAAYRLAPDCSAVWARRSTAFCDGAGRPQHQPELWRSAPGTVAEQSAGQPGRFRSGIRWRCRPRYLRFGERRIVDGDGVLLASTPMVVRAPELALHFDARLPRVGILKVAVHRREIDERHRRHDAGRMFGNAGAPACAGDRLTPICRRLARSVVLPADNSALASARSGTRS